MVETKLHFLGEHQSELARLEFQAKEWRDVTRILGPTALWALLDSRQEGAEKDPRDFSRLRRRKSLGDKLATSPSDARALGL
jgi:hypothetical protein